LIVFRPIITTLGVSADAAKAQAKFKDKYNSFRYSLMRISPLLSFGVWGPKIYGKRI
jgi:peroxiredoxin